MNIKTVMRYISFFIVSLVLLTGCGDNNSPQYQHSMDNNIGKIENSKSNRVISNKISVTSASKIAGLYVAYFKRAPDLKGLNFWKNRATNSEEALKELSAGFAKHPTFISTYKDMSNQEFVEAIYHNVLSKAGDTEGIEYWTKYLDGGKSRSDMVAEFVEISLAEEVTAENYSNLTTQQLAIAQERQDYITNKVKVALSFTTLLGTHTNVANDQHPESDPAYLASIKILSDVTGDSASVSRVIDFLNGIKGDDDPIDRINHPPKTKGYLIDSPLQGVTYLCDGEENLTDASGMFECVNPPVTFKIGNLTLGTLTEFTADGKVYPQDLLLDVARTNFTDSRLKLLTRLLQSLDDDGDIGTKITITQSVRSKITAVQDFKDMSQSDVQSLLSGLGKSLVKECGALKHLGANVTCNNNGSYYVYTPPVSTPPTPNTAPTANAQTLSVEEDTIYNEITLRGTDADGDALTYTIVTQPTHGTLGGTVPNMTYVPTDDYFGDDSFTFKVNDGTIDSAPATVTMTVNAVNDAPILSKDNLTVSFNEHNVSRIPMPVKAESVDMDGDGDIDIVSASWGAYSTLGWYENDGTQNFLEHNISTYDEDEFGIWSIKSIDFDNDGDIDIITSNYSEETYETNTSIRWYENDGSQNFTEHNLSSEIFAVGLDIQDIDGDGDIDIVASPWWWDGKTNTSIVWLENDGSQNFTEHNVTKNHESGMFSIKAVDIDGDGDIDLLPSREVSNNNNNFSWYENDGSQNFTEHNITTDSENSNFSYSAEAIDLDKDGDIDILTTVFDNDEESGNVIWYENDGSQNFTEHNISQLGALIELDVKAIDIDNDGDMDVIGGHNWYENDGNQGFTIHNITSVFTVYFTLSDIDGDGDADIALPYWENSLIVWQENLGVTTLYVKENNTTVGTMTASDVDGDSLTYSISGVDADKFDINATTGLLTFKVDPDYEAPIDDNEDNIYELNVAVTDGSESDDLDIRVIVENDITDNNEGEGDEDVTPTET